VPGVRQPASRSIGPASATCASSASGSARRIVPAAPLLALLALPVARLDAHEGDPSSIRREGHGGRSDVGLHPWREGQLQPHDRPSCRWTAAWRNLRCKERRRRNARDCPRRHASPPQGREFQVESRLGRAMSRTTQNRNWIMRIADHPE
jgi:hypothetical protein